MLERLAVRIFVTLLSEKNVRILTLGLLILEHVGTCLSISQRICYCFSPYDPACAQGAFLALGLPFLHFPRPRPPKPPQNPGDDDTPDDVHEDQQQPTVSMPPGFTPIELTVSSSRPPGPPPGGSINVVPAPPMPLPRVPDHERDDDLMEPATSSRRRTAT